MCFKTRLCSRDVVVDFFGQTHASDCCWGKQPHRWKERPTSGGISSSKDTDIQGYIYIGVQFRGPAVTLQEAEHLEKEGLLFLALELQIKSTTFWKWTRHFHSSPGYLWIWKHHSTYSHLKVLWASVLWACCWVKTQQLVAFVRIFNTSLIGWH